MTRRKLLLGAAVAAPLTRVAVPCIPATTGLLTGDNFCNVVYPNGVTVTTRTLKDGRLIDRIVAVTEPYSAC